MDYGEIILTGHIMTIKYNINVLKHLKRNDLLLVLLV